MTIQLNARQRGDFQTPKDLASKVWATLDSSDYDLVIEPTFGRGSFITTLPDDYRADIIGWEIQEDYYRAALVECKAAGNLHLVNADIFTITEKDIPTTPETTVLVIGNPPWVTNAEQGSLGGKNTGRKQNFKALNGLDALTGKSNFDVSEAIILRLVNLLSRECKVAQFALLVKFSVVRSLLQYFEGQPLIGDFEYHMIDALRYFGAAVDAGLFKFRLGGDNLRRFSCLMYEDIGGKKAGEVGLVNSKLVYDIPAFNRVSFMENKGQSFYVWRQGVKHDAAKILELAEQSGALKNRLGETVEIEQETLHQLYKSSDIFHGRTSRFVIPIYQRSITDPMSDLEQRYPKLYSYLRQHEAYFLARKSSIYKHRPVFTMFGIGDYTHARYKIAIAGLYTQPVFRLLQPSPRPVVLDDTGYMLPTNDRREAIYLLAVLSLDSTRDFLCSISHPRDKRRFSKDTLQRLRIPPYRECSQSLRDALVISWEQTGAFSVSQTQQLTAWLAEHTPFVAPNSALQESFLF